MDAEARHGCSTSRVAAAAGLLPGSEGLRLCGLVTPGKRGAGRSAGRPVMASWHLRQGATTGNGTVVPDFGWKEAEERLAYEEDEDGGVRWKANDVRGSSFPLRLTRRSESSMFGVGN
jgi:hypothetical protein